MNVKAGLKYSIFCYYNIWTCNIYKAGLKYNISCYYNILICEVDLKHNILLL